MPNEMTNPSATSRLNRSALPSAWVDRLFDLLFAMYGQRWTAMWADAQSIDDIKAVWAEDLAGVNADQIRRALDHLKGNNPHPPTLPEFLGLCRQFRVAEPYAALPSPRDEPAPEVKALINDIGKGKTPDYRAWAKKILANPKAYPHISVEFAREAMGVRDA